MAATTAKTKIVISTIAARGNGAFLKGWRIDDVCGAVATGDVTGVPQTGQNRASSVSLAPHLRQ